MLTEINKFSRDVLLLAPDPDPQVLPTLALLEDEELYCDWGSGELARASYMSVKGKMVCAVRIG